MTAVAPYHELRDDYVDAAGGDVFAAAVALAFDLAQDDSATLKAGYTVENAAYAATTYVLHTLDRKRVAEVADALRVKLGSS